MSWIERAKAGDKVSPTDDGKDFKNIETGEICLGPCVGDIVTISRIHRFDIGVFFQLEEHGAPWFDAEDFRPLRDTTHQVEALKRLCNPTPEVVA